MARATEDNLYEVDELLVQPGTYFNPQTEVVVIVDDSTSLDQEVFNMEAYEGADWVRVSDDVPVDEDRRDQLLEAFQTHYHPGATGSVSETALEQGDDELDEDEDGPGARPRGLAAPGRPRRTDARAGPGRARLHPPRPGRRGVTLSDAARRDDRPLLLPARRHPRLHDPGLRNPRPRRRLRGRRRPGDRRLPRRAGGAEASSPTNTTSSSPCSPTPTTRSPRPTAPGARSRCTARSTWGSCARPSSSTPTARSPAVFPKVQPKKHDALVLKALGALSDGASA